LEDRCLLSGTFNEFQTPTLGSGPHGITAGPDGNVWFTELTANHIGRITPSGSITEIVIPTPNSQPSEITRGPDGNLWFTEMAGNKIGKITPAGVITEFTVSTSNSGPTGITTGSDGNLWFTEFNTGKIGRITTAGVITEFSLPSPISGPLQITSGPDNNLWFTEQNSSQIGLITPTGSNSITEYALPSGLGSSNNPYGITKGPDGNLWFTEAGSNHIGKITTQGIVSLFTIPTANSGPHGIVLGSDGNLYFAETNSNKIASVSTTGVFTENVVTTPNSLPTEVTLGRDSNLWFSEFNTRNIGQFILPHYIVTGAGAGSLPEVRLFNAATGQLLKDFNAYDPRFLGGVRVALGNVDGTGVPDIITAPGPGGGPDVRVYSGITGNLIREFMAFSPFFQGGVNIASGDFNADGFDDIIVGADAGGGPEVKVYSGADATNSTILYDAFVYDSHFRGGVRVGAGDVEGNGHADVIAGPGATGGPDIRVISGLNGKLVQEFLAYDVSFTAGVYVAGGNINPDGHADIIVGPESGPPNVKVFSGLNDSLLQSFDAYTQFFLGGVRVSSLPDINGNGSYDILTGAGPTGGPQASVFNSSTLVQLDSFYAYNVNQSTGIYVGGM
jgi:streptogramin lyase